MVGFFDSTISKKQKAHIESTPKKQRRWDFNENGDLQFVNGQTKETFADTYYDPKKKSTENGFLIEKKSTFFDKFYNAVDHFNKNDLLRC